MIRGAKAIILDNHDNILILRRSVTHPHVPHTPDLPGGRVEDGETMIEGLLREINEETGLSLEDSELSLITTHKEHNYFGHAYHLELFEIKLKNRPDVILSNEHEMYEWLPRSDAEIIGNLYSSLLQSYQLSIV